MFLAFLFNIVWNRISIRVVFFRIHYDRTTINWRNKYVTYDSLSIAFQIAFNALNQLNKLAHDVFQYVQCFDLEIRTGLSFNYPINICVHVCLWIAFSLFIGKTSNAWCREKAVKGENVKWFNLKLDFLRKNTSRNAWVFWHVKGMHG